MFKQMKVLFCPMSYVGPINASIGMAEVLRDAGYQVVFAIKSGWAGKLSKYGFQEEIIASKSDGSPEENVDDVSYLFGKNTRLQKLKLFNTKFNEQEQQVIREDDPLLEEIIKRVKPDVIVIEEYFWVPSVMGSSIPWVWSMSSNPLAFEVAVRDELLPPMCLGLPTNSDPNEWKLIRKELDEGIQHNFKKHNDWVISKGFQSLPENKMMRPSPYLNIYMFPKELDYIDIRPYPPNFFGFDCMIRTAADETFELPEKLMNRRGKLIYLSMGSMGSANIELMKKLVDFLSKSEHRFIVSKGSFGDQYELPDNMWGQNYLPQIKILPIIDLMITHGGNNTLTELMYFGKLMLVMPLFFDQFDNAQRVSEKGLGIELDPYSCTQTELIESIDKLLSDKPLQQKLSAISKRIQSERNILKLPKLLSKLVEVKNK